MSLEQLSENERQIVLECLRAAYEGPFFPDEEFHTIFGLYRAEIGEVISSWPDIDESQLNVKLAINNAMNNLLGYPHRRQDVWAEYISVTAEEVYRVFSKWRGESDGRYFDRMM